MFDILFERDLIFCDEDEISDVIVEEVTDATGWCVCSLNYRHVLNTH